MLNIVIPMAGRGSRFAQAGYRDPKPLISVCGKSMIELVIGNLRPKCKHNFIFICQAEHLNNYPLRNLLETIAPGCTIIEANGITEGSACTVLLARKYIDNKNQLMIANCDQYINLDINQYLSKLDLKLDGLIMTMKDKNKKWSYIEFNSDNEITRVVEKEVVSEEATVGIYNYQHGYDFIRSAEQMIKKNLRVNGEFYVAPAYNEMILNDKKIGYFNIGSHGTEMHGLGTPEDLLKYVESKQESNLKL